jgi:acetolactate synthase-1/2/3 large subunit
MHGMEVHTACEYDIPVIWLVVNNGGHGMVYHGENLLFGGRFHNSLFRRPLNIAKLASSLGVSGFQVTRPGELCGLMEECLRRGRPAVIEAVVDPEEIPPIGARVRAVDQYLNQATAKMN